MTCPALPEGFDFTDPDVNQARVPLPEFAALRQSEPVRWIPQQPGTTGFDDGGYWAVTRHADVKEVSVHPETFSSAANTAIIRFHPDISRDGIDGQRVMMLNMAPPEHTRLRQIVQRGFTPRAVNALRQTLRERAEQIVAEARAQGRGDFVRRATPVMSFQRTATRDVELGAAKISAGQGVGIFYSSANNDPSVFHRPEEFDILRDPNPHLGFGGGGPHFCLGANLARLELDLVFDAIADAVPGIRSAGPARRLRSAWLNGIKELPVQYT